jgi:hypothetical protein
MQVPLSHPLPQFWEDYFDKVITLSVHIAESGGDEDADGFPSLCHLVYLLTFHSPP